ncbi:MAG: hypothetical protein RQ966_10440 [Acetobacteraceae bacterium]|nr:hypothetical protein [Acetobacteraceae bacterium]
MDISTSLPAPPPTHPPAGAAPPGPATEPAAGTKPGEPAGSKPSAPAPVIHPTVQDYISIDHCLMLLRQV